METTPRHPALNYSFDDLLSGLMARVETGAIGLSTQGSLSLFNYTKDCQFRHLWDEFTVLARGLILDVEAKQIVALPLPKFFNLSEAEGAKVVRFGSAFDAYTKMDGSLGVVYHHDGSWHVATRGSFTSDQSRWAETWLHGSALLDDLDPEVTYLMEIIYQENRIVITYPFEGLVMLAAYNRLTGVELDHARDLMPLCEETGTKMALRHEFDSLQDAQEFVKTLPGTEEGFVIRFRDTGDRVKLKGAEYCILHKMISNITPLALWELLCAGYSMEDYKKAMPEEFWDEIDEIVSQFTMQTDRKMGVVSALHGETMLLSDRDLGMAIQGGDLKGRDGAGFLFPLRKKGVDVVRRMILKDLRPSDNVIESYTPSKALARSQSEE